MGVLSNLIVRIGANTDDFDKKVNAALGKTKRFAADITAAGEALSIGFSLPLAAAGGAALKAAADVETMQKGLSATMKSAELAGKEFERLKDVARLPGLGLEEAVKGSIRLQSLGTSADSARRIMSELGNAIAVVGGGREDFNEVIRQLSQLGAVGKVTKENLDPIIERIPQLARIIKEKFGPEALGDPAKTFEKLGISSQKLIQILVDELAKGERAGGTFKNSLENMSEAARLAAAEFGKSLMPAAQRVMDEFLTPAIEKANELAKAFAGLSPSTQNWAIGLTAVTAAMPIVITGLGVLIEKSAVVLGAINKLIPALKAFAGGITLAGSAAAAAGIGVAAFMNMLNTHRQNTVDTTAEAIKKLNEKAGTGTPVAFGAGTDAILGYMRVLKPSIEATKTSGDEHETAAKKVKKHADHFKDLNAVTVESEMLMRLMSEATHAHASQVDKAADIVRSYGTVSVDTAIESAKAWDKLYAATFRLSDAPKVGSLFEDFKKLPKAPDPGLPTADWKAFEQMSKNIGEYGMLTKAQYDGIKVAAKDTSKVQQAALRQVSTVITDMSRSMARAIVEWKGWGEAVKSVAKSAAEAIIRQLIEGALAKLAAKLLDVGGIFGKVFGGGSGAIMSAASGGASAASGAAGSASSVGGVASAASAGIMGTIGAIGSAVSAVSGIIGNFQNARMEGTMNQVERNTAAASIHLLHLLEKNNEYLPKLADIWGSLIRMETRQTAPSGGGGNNTYVINVTGGSTQQIVTELTRQLKLMGVRPANA